MWDLWWTKWGWIFGESHSYRVPVKISETVGGKHGQVQSWPREHGFIMD
jgi:hypothetical protein